ncbi:MAG: 4a-hydroxytetrahydrobiopterin dehydratase [Anaerolineaceae bacterium]|nr:4a-hydroxytetrahydrobiopterin dehydratase [Anaerolineaceae bacterium]
MTTSLYELNCTRVNKNDDPATVEQIREWIKELDAWKIGKVEGKDRLTKEFKFGNFMNALNFTNQVGELAEKQDHHPVIVTEWGKVTVTLWTHVIDGLHKNDFILAAKIDKIFNNGGL